MVRWNDLGGNGLALCAADRCRQGIGAAWFFITWSDYFNRDGMPDAYPVLVALIWLVSLWTGSTAARHLLLLSLIGYAAMLADGNMLAGSLLLMVVSAALFAASVVAPAAVERIARLDDRLPLHALIGFLVGAALLQIQYNSRPAVLVIAGILVFGAIAAALMLAGRTSRGLRWVAYFGFACELAFLYVQTIGSMLGTAGLFLAAGVVLGLLAVLIIRIERRVNAPEVA